MNAPSTPRMAVRYRASCRYSVSSSDCDTASAAAENASSRRLRSVMSVAMPQTAYATPSASNSGNLDDRNVWIPSPKLAVSSNVMLRFSCSTRRSLCRKRAASSGGNSSSSVRPRISSAARPVTRSNSRLTNRYWPRLSFAKTVAPELSSTCCSRSSLSISARSARGRDGDSLAMPPLLKGTVRRKYRSRLARRQHCYVADTNM